MKMQEEWTVRGNYSWVETQPEGSPHDLVFTKIIPRSPQTGIHSEVMGSQRAEKLYLGNATFKSNCSRQILYISSKV